MMYNLLAIKKKFSDYEKHANLLKDVPTGKRINLSINKNNSFSELKHVTLPSILELKMILKKLKLIGHLWRIIGKHLLL